MMSEFSTGQMSIQVSRRRFLSFILSLCVLTQSAALPARASSGPGLQPILDYISNAWDTLTRSVTDCQSLVDPKLKEAAVLYLPAGMLEPSAVRKLSSEC